MLPPGMIMIMMMLIKTKHNILSIPQLIPEEICRQVPKEVCQAVFLNPKMLKVV